MKRMRQAIGYALLVIGLFSALPVASVAASDYPARNIRTVVPFAPGEPIDAVARSIAQRLTETWGQAIVVDNRPGASGTRGAVLVAKAPRDGYTLLITAQSQSINAAVIKPLPYDTLRGFTHISQVARGYRDGTTHMVCNRWNSCNAWPPWCRRAGLVRHGGAPMRCPEFLE
jgi:tripartite-type tricarboxylate transporter receptor subunit TctC